MQIRREPVRIDVEGTTLDGDLSLPDGAEGIVLFAHGSGSSRRSPRNRFVAETLQRGGLATLLIDLLTRAEEQTDSVTGELRFDIGFLAERLVGVSDWLATTARTRDLSLGYFGASTGAAAALVAAAERPGVQAIVSRGGRPDLAGDALELVTAPTLLIVGGSDVEVLRLNQLAGARLGGDKRLDIVPLASHLFEEPGALGRVAELARDWFREHLAAAPIGLPAGETARP